MAPSEDPNTEIRSDLLRLEGKIDVILGRHEERIDQIRRDLDRMRDDLTRRPTNYVASWVAVAVAALAVVLDPILNTLLAHKP